MKDVIIGGFVSFVVGLLYATTLMMDSRRDAVKVGIIVVDNKAYRLTPLEIPHD